MIKLRRQLALPQKIPQRKRHVSFSKVFIFLFFVLNFLFIAHSTFKVIGFQKNTYSNASNALNSNNISATTTLTTTTTTTTTTTATTTTTTTTTTAKTTAKTTDKTTETTTLAPVPFITRTENAFVLAYYPG